MIKNCIIIHGCPSKEEGMLRRETKKHWIPWIKNQLEKIEIETFAPLMPEPWEPDYKKFKDEFEKYEVSEKSVLIGHSCGCSFLVRWLWETKKEISKLILVAPWKISEKAEKSEKEFYEFPIDDNIKDRVKEIIMFTSDNEAEDWKKWLKMFHEILGGKIIDIKWYGHYILIHMQKEDFPELLDEILK